MIYLTQVCERLSEILNSSDNPVSYTYAVESVGYHWDRVYKDKKNIIRVFVSSMGGAFNPVFGLGEANYTIPIIFYFPVRFKEDFFLLDRYLHSVLVGASFGVENSISNLSVSQFGEIQNLDMKEFSSWSERTFQVPTDITEEYMTMQCTLYLSTLKEGYVYGNSVTAKLKHYIDMCELIVGDKTYMTYYLKTIEDAGVERALYITEEGKIVTFDNLAYYYDEKTGELTEIEGGEEGSGGYAYMEIPLTFSQGSLQSSTQGDSQQVIGEGESKSIPFTTAYGSSFTAYLNTSAECEYLLYQWANATLTEKTFTIEISIPEMNISYEREVYVQSCNLPIIKGQPLSLTMSFARRLD